MKHYLVYMKNNRICEIKVFPDDRLQEFIAEYAVAKTRLKDNDCDYNKVYQFSEME